ncbi:MAG: hypothetical protein ACRDY6_12015 [Acidimicrobiia bacterium]
MKRVRKLPVIAAAAVAVAAAGTGIGIAAAGSRGDDAEPAITGSELDQASAAALDHTDGGTVTETEVGDEESYYEVEVTLDDGSQVDVQLDRDFNVVGSEGDGAGEDEGPNDD